MLENFGRYQLIDKLATGGMGQVFLARQKGPVGFEKLLVVKRVLPHLSEEEDFIDMFFDEARIAALLNHPNIAQIYDLGDVEGTYFLAMEYVHGVSVRDLSARPDMPVGLKCRVMADAAAGLDYAHEAQNAQGEPLGLIHRDVSPQNVLIGFTGGVKVIDFGVAKAAGKISTTMTGTIKGKYAYMSPEQARGQELDNRSDIFGLGIVFWEFLTGERLFKRENDTATLKAVVSGKVPAPSSLVKGVPKALDHIVLRALEVDASVRYQSAAELGFALEDFLIQGKLPASSAHLSLYMREAYPKESQPRIITAARGGPARAVPVREEASRSGSLQTQADKSVSRSRTTFERTELERVLARFKKTDLAAGVLFNAVVKAVQNQAGEATAAAVRGERIFVDAKSYPAADFFNVLWKAAKAITPLRGSSEEAFWLLGQGMSAALLVPGFSRGLSATGQAGDGTATLLSLLAAWQGALQPGSRRIESATSKSAVLAFENDPFPLRFHAGLLQTSFERLRAVPLQISWEGSDEEQRLRCRW